MGVEKRPYKSVKERSRTWRGAPQRSEFNLHCCLKHKLLTECEAKVSYVKFDVLFLEGLLNCTTIYVMQIARLIPWYQEDLCVYVLRDCYLPLAEQN